MTVMSLLYLVEFKAFNRDVIRFAMDKARVDRFLIRGRWTDRSCVLLNFKGKAAIAVRESPADRKGTGS